MMLWCLSGHLLVFLHFHARADIPWSQFVFAEGGADEIRMAFSTHDIVITGEGLNKLLPEITDQRLSLLKEPVRAESFTPFSAPQITGISIKKVE